MQSFFFRPAFMEWFDSRKKKQINRERGPLQTPPQKQEATTSTRPAASMTSRRNAGAVNAENQGEPADQDGNSTTEDTDGFLRSHFFLNEDKEEDEEADIQLEDPLNVSVSEDVTVGSFVLPTKRGSVLWNAVHISEEITDDMVVVDMRQSLPMNLHGRPTWAAEKRRSLVSFAESNPSLTTRTRGRSLARSIREDAVYEVNDHSSERDDVILAEDSIESM